MHNTNMANTTAEKRWYVFDEHDCFDNFPYEQGQRAMDCALDIQRDGLDGVHVVCMTKPQFDEYCKSGDLRAAMKK